MIKNEDLPELIGSEKQIKWAKNIRKEYIEIFEVEQELLNSDFVQNELNRMIAEENKLKQECKKHSEYSNDIQSLQNTKNFAKIFLLQKKSWNIIEIGNNVYGYYMNNLKDILLGILEKRDILLAKRHFNKIFSVSEDLLIDFILDIKIPKEKYKKIYYEDFLKMNNLEKYEFFIKSCCQIYHRRIRPIDLQSNLKNIGIEYYDFWNSFEEEFDFKKEYDKLDYINKIINKQKDKSIVAREHKNIIFKNLAISYRIVLPKSWASLMELDKSNRNVIVKFKKNRIVIEKNIENDIIEEENIKSIKTTISSSADGGYSVLVGIPQLWLNKLGFRKNDRSAILKYYKNKIIIKKGR